MAFASNVNDASNESAELQAAVYFDHESATAFLVCRNLPEVDGLSDYRLVVIDESGAESSSIAKFPYTGGLVGAPIPVDLRLANDRLGIVPAGGGSPVMISL